MRTVRHVLSLVGARPNFMKAAPVVAALGNGPPTIVHTGQRYDEAMSRIFVDELGIGEPGHMLSVGVGHARGPDGSREGGAGADHRGDAA